MTVIRFRHEGQEKVQVKQDIKSARQKHAICASMLEIKSHDIHWHVY